ncbi:unnamed protein product [Soboliphyme baturini]|uniref:Transposase n=1 Tax=Soboliphyme baturini TaxID=241478 RepID=A0A183ICL8_9BILA|nr:unnamed protein product [Soboliphyme baturini]
MHQNVAVADNFGWFAHYLLEDTEPLWQEHCGRDFSDVNPDLESGETFRELYEVLKRIEANLYARQAKLADAKAPREVRRRQLKYGTAVKNLPTTEDIIESRRRISSDPKGCGKTIFRSGICNSDDIVCSKKVTVSKAPLMVKTLKMMKKCRTGRF